MADLNTQNVHGRRERGLEQTGPAWEKWPALYLALTLALCLAACSKSSTLPPADGGVQDGGLQQDGGPGAAPVFTAIPATTLETGQTHKIDLDDYLSDGDNPNSDLTVTATPSAHINTRVSIFHILTLTPQAGWHGTETVTLKAKDPEGNEGTGSVTLTVEDQNIQPLSCDTTFHYRPATAISSVAVAGEFNNWSTTATPLTDPDNDGLYTAKVTIPTGSYGYKLVVNGSDWQLDPQNPFRVYVNEVENSRIIVPDCKAPLFKLLALNPNGPARTTSVQVALLDGAEQSGINTSSISVTLDGQPVTPNGYNSGTSTFNLNLTGLTKGKHVLRFNAAESGGRSAQELYLPWWIEDTTFTWADSIMYFAFIDRFRNGNPSNDNPVNGVPTIANWQGGDYAGAKAAIEEGYFDNIGVNALWITAPYLQPNHADPGADGRSYAPYHGYFPADSYSVDPHFGTANELKALIAAAQAKGIRVLIDFAANHVHSDHPWWAQHQGDGWFYDYNTCDNGGFDLRPLRCWFRPYLPDLNYTVPAVVDAMVDNAIWWIKEFGIDGFRVDAVKHMPHVLPMTLRARIQKEIETTGLKFYMVGETFVGQWEHGGQNTIKLYVNDWELDGQFDFPLYWEILGVIGRNEDSFSDLEEVVRQTADFYGPRAIMSNFLGNHDVPRFISHANGDIADRFGGGSKEQGWTNPPGSPSASKPYEKLKLAFTFLMSIKGIPLIYCGDEIGLPGAGDPDNRRALRFNPSLSTNEVGVLTHLAKVSAIRHQYPALRTGAYRTLVKQHNVFAFARHDTKHVIVVALNRSDSPANAISAPIVAELGVPQGAVFTDAISQTTATANSGTLSINLPAISGAIYVWTRP